MRVAEIGNNILHSRLTKCIFFVLCFVILFAKSDRHFGWTNPQARKAYPVLSDGSGYYAYLPQWFTYHTDKFQFADSIGRSYHNTRFVEFAGYPPSAGVKYNKYYPGTAVCLTPFYLAAKVHASASGHKTDGYSWPFLLWCNIGIICFTLFGALGMFNLFRLFNLKTDIAYLLVAGALFGTNLCYYTTVEIPFSHVFCFAINTWFFVCAKQWATTADKRSFYGMMTLLGLALIIRPTNIFVVIALPFLFNTLTDFWSAFKDLVTKYQARMLIGTVLFFLAIAIFLWNNYLQTGKLTINSYSNETFSNWKNPFLFDVLFSYKKGLFVYAPIFFLLLPGMVVCFFKNRKLFWISTLIFVLVTYTSASWWIWWFGGGLGARNYIDFIPVFFLTIGVFIQYGGRWIKLLTVPLIAMAIFLYQVFDYQMRNAIIHYSEVSEADFWTVFLQTDSRFKFYRSDTFDAAPGSSVFIGKSLVLKNQNGAPVGQYPIHLKKEEFADDPFVAVRVDRQKSTGLFGIKFQSDILIHDADANPHLVVVLYKKKRELAKNEIQFGSKIPGKERFYPVELYWNTNWKMNEVDSVLVWFNQVNVDLSVKRQKVQFYKY